MVEFSTFKGSWPWPWIGSYCISLIDLYLHTKFHWNQRNVLWTNGRTERHFETGFIRSRTRRSRPHQWNCLHVGELNELGWSWLAVSFDWWIDWFIVCEAAADCHNVHHYLSFDTYSPVNHCNAQKQFNVCWHCGRSNPVGHWFIDEWIYWLIDWWIDWLFRRQVFEHCFS